MIGAAKGVTAGLQRHKNELLGRAGLKYDLSAARQDPGIGDRRLTQEGWRSELVQAPAVIDEHELISVSRTSTSGAGVKR